MDLELLIAQWSGQLPPGFLLPAERPEARPQCSHKRCHRPVAIKRQRRVGESLPALPRPPRPVLSSPESVLRRPGRLPALRLPQAGGRRLPLRAVPRGPRRRARAETTGCTRRGGDRRVRRRSPRPRTGPAIWAAVCRPGTRGRSRLRPPPTGRRFPIRSPRPSRSGAGRRATAACTAGTDPSSAVEARRLRSSRRRPPFLSRAVLRAHSQEEPSRMRARASRSGSPLAATTTRSGFRIRRSLRRAAGPGGPPARSRTARPADAWPAPPRSTARRRRPAARR